MQHWMQLIILYCEMEVQIVYGRGDSMKAAIPYLKRNGTGKIITIRSGIV